MTKEANPNIPITPDEIVEEAYRCWNEGASIVHVHARDKDGKATTNPEIFQEISQKIREKKCDIILQFSTSPGRELTANIEDGFRVLTVHPEMASCDIGVSVHTRPGEEQVSLWTRSFNERMTRACFEKGIKPEFEVYDLGGMVELNYLLERIPLSKPYSIQFPMDMQRTRQNVIPYSPKNLMHLVDELPEDAIFTAFGVAAAELPAIVQSVLLGGHVRVGFEDNVYYSRGVLAKSNAELVARIARIGSELGRKVATPSEARELLGLARLR